MVLPFFFPVTLILRFAGPEGAKNPAGKCPPPDSNPLETRSLEKITPACQDNFAAAPTAESQSNKHSQCLFARLPRTLSHNASGQSKLHNEPLRSPVASSACHRIPDR